jgi:flagellar motility protein MotE (MotC chaperone)
MANLDALDYVPGEEEMVGDETSMSVEDSIEAVNWLENEKTKLAEREKELDAREKKLNVLDAKVSQQIVKIEQAESARISKLAKLYDGMEARSVAKLIANLDDDTVVALLPRMKLKQASSVLALMPPIRAARLSKQMITIAEN